MKVKILFAYVAVSLLLAGCTSQAQKQAMGNAHALYPVQKAQSAKKDKQWEGMKLVITSTGLNVDGKPAAVVEKTADATVYQQGLYNYIVYKNGKIAVTNTSGIFKGNAK